MMIKMVKAIRKPEEIDVIQYNGTNENEVLEFIQKQKSAIGLNGKKKFLKFSKKKQFNLFSPERGRIPSGLRAARRNRRMYLDICPKSHDGSKPPLVECPKGNLFVRADIECESCGHCVKLIYAAPPGPIDLEDFWPGCLECIGVLCNYDGIDDHIKVNE
jgi:hypothetical protein